MQISMHMDDGPAQRFWHIAMGLATIFDGLVQVISLGFLFSQTAHFFENKLVLSRKYKPWP